MKDGWNERKNNEMNERLMKWMKNWWNEWKIDGINEKLMK